MAVVAVVAFVVVLEVAVLVAVIVVVGSRDGGDGVYGPQPSFIT